MFVLLDSPKPVDSSDVIVTPIQDIVLKKLYNWRDLKARELDESVVYIMSHALLLRIGEILVNKVFNEL